MNLYTFTSEYITDRVCAFLISFILYFTFIDWVQGQHAYAFARPRNNSLRKQFV